MCCRRFRTADASSILDSSLGAVHDALDLVGGLLDAADEVAGATASRADAMGVAEFKLKNFFRKKKKQKKCLPHVRLQLRETEQLATVAHWYVNVVQKR